jgi:ferredoxin-type protein NapG
MVKTNRREFLQIAVQGTGIAACSGLGLLGLARGAHSQSWAPRPPGAAENFSTLCMKCGLCVKACPYDTLKLAKLGDRAPLGTPFFEPRDIPCYMCPDVPCVKVCPSGALKRDFDDIKKARMGVAVIDPSSCLSWQGLRCEVCYRDCPVKDEALKLAPHPRGLSKHAVFVPVINPNKCTGCGLCTWSCPTQKPAINILDRETFLGHIGDHYRLGWLEDQPHDPAPLKRPISREDEAKPTGVDYLNNMEDPL